MNKTLTQCIHCLTCQDSDNTIHQVDDSIFYSSGLCFDCFTVIVRENQVARYGYFCFGTDEDCVKVNCSYKEKCIEARNIT